MKKVYIETLGCQMNKSDSERILSILKYSDYTETQDPKIADLLIVNTCNIRQLSADKAYSLIGTWGKWKKNKNIKIAFCGCVAQLEKEHIFKRASYVDLIFNAANIFRLPELIKKIEQGDKIIAVNIDNKKFTETNIEKIERKDNLNAWIPIIEGCNNFCTYCIVPFTRGRERSRQPQIILNEAKQAVKLGYKELTLLGQNVDSYGKDLKDDNITLANLLRQINAIKGQFRIRFVTSYPSDITDDLIKSVQECDKVCKYFHIPMQSGNSQILKAMNRHYTKQQYIDIVKKIRSAFNDEVCITSDFIAGFPGETQEQFEDTLNIIDQLQIDYSNTAAYSPRPFTKAAKMKELFIDEETKKQRLKILNDKNKQAVLKSNKKCIGKTYKVLVESFEIKDTNKVILRSRADNNKIIHFEGSENLLGQFVYVKVLKATTWSLQGQLA